METIGNINRATILTTISIALASVQSVLLQIWTTDSGHKIFSIYFFLELFILLLTLSTGLKTRLSMIIFLLTFLFETFWFIKNERPISPDLFLMLIIGLTRIYILYWLTKQYKNKKGKRPTLVWQKTA